MLKDLRYAVRMLLQAKAWTAVVVISLALGIGANTALFGAINGLLLKEIPVRESDTLVRLRWAGRNDMVTSSSDYGPSNKDALGRDVRTTFSFPMFRQLVADNRTMSDLLACAPVGRVNVVADGHAEIATALISSGNYYQALGVRAAFGRTILPADDTPSAPPVAVISHKYWRTRFGGDPHVVGKAVQVNNVPVTIVGVIEPEFTGIQLPVADPPDVGVPLAIDPQLNPGPPRLSQPTFWWLQIVGRLKPGMTAQQAQGNLEGVFQQTARSGLAAYLAGLAAEARATSVNRNRKDVPSLLVDSAGHGIYDVNATDKRAVAVLTGVVVLVLLIVCANVANLLLSRATTRQKEFSVRLSMGATRWRLVRQMLTESVLIAAMGGALGLVIGYWGQRLLPGAAGQVMSPDWRVFGFVLGVTAVTGILFGLAPALRATAVNVSAALKETSRTVAGHRSILGKALLVVQVAVSLVLLVGAGLFLQTLQNLRQVNVGFNPRNLVLFTVNPQLNRYDEQRVLALYGQLLDRLRAVGGVRGVSFSNPAMLAGSVNQSSFFVQGRAYAQGQRDSINRVVVSPNFFELMEIPVLVGRGLTEADRETAPKVAVINDAAVRTYFANQNPIGTRFGSSVETAGQIEIVGVVRDVKYNSVRDAAPPTMYVPYLQTRVPFATFEARTAGDPSSAVGAIREAVRQIDPNLPIVNVSTQMEQIERRFLQEKIFAQANALFGGIALLLAAIGLFGLMSYNVARRTNEIGIRMALGAQPQHVLQMVMSESMIMVAAGVVIGIVLALAAARLVSSLLFGLGATDLRTMVLSIVVMVAVSAIAGYLPARRAARVDPMVALHYE
jgi:predicted permease